VAIVMYGRSRASQFIRAIAQAKAILNSDFVDTLNSELVRIRRQLNNGPN